MSRESKSAAIAVEMDKAWDQFYLAEDAYQHSYRAFDKARKRLMAARSTQVAFGRVQDIVGSVWEERHPPEGDIPSPPERDWNEGASSPSYPGAKAQAAEQCRVRLAAIELGDE